MSHCCKVLCHEVLSPEVLTAGSLQAHFALGSCSMPCSVSHSSWAHGNVLSTPVENTHVFRSGVCCSISRDLRLPGQRDVPVAAQVSPAPGGAAGAWPQCWALRAVPEPIPMCCSQFGELHQCCSTCGESSDPFCLLEGDIPLVLPRALCGSSRVSPGWFFILFVILAFTHLP